VDGVPTVEQAIAPVIMGDEVPAGFHSMELTDSQEQAQALRGYTTAAGVRPALH